MLEMHSFAEVMNVFYLNPRLNYHRHWINILPVQDLTFKGKLGAGKGAFRVWRHIPTMKLTFQSPHFLTFQQGAPPLTIKQQWSFYFDYLNRAKKLLLELNRPHKLFLIAFKNVLFLLYNF